MSNDKKIEELSAIAKKNGGTCLSKKYLGYTTKLKWKCSEGHVWSSAPRNIKAGSWCPKCFRLRSRLKLEDLKKIANEKGGEVLSELYNPNIKIKIQCKAGHLFKIRGPELKSGVWCKECANESMRMDIEVIREKAKSLGGKCLSKTYKNNLQKLKWECVKGHRWEATYGSISAGRWCPECGNLKKGISRRKYGIKDAQRVAKKNQGKCLSGKLSITSDSLLWECKNGHRWNAKFDHVLRGSWCPECSLIESGLKRRKYTLKDIKVLVAKKGGKLLSSEVGTVKEKVHVLCGCGFEFFPNSSSLEKGSWCPRCAGNKVDKESVLKEVCKNRSLKCLSKNYINNQSKYEWQCLDCNNRWLATYANIRRGKNCPVCARQKADLNRRKYCIEDVRKIVEKLGGDLLEDKYKSFNSKYKVKCLTCEHEWSASFSNLLKGHWCASCSGHLPPKRVDLESIAKERGGNLISKRVGKSDEKLKWTCKLKHIFYMQPNYVVGGNWCPECSRGRGERICRIIFESLTKRKFPTKKPKWLINAEGNRLELDGFNENLGVAFEHQGEQHYKEIAFFHGSKKKFEKLVRDDKRKRYLCKKNDVILIEVPSITIKITIEDAIDFIRNELLKNNIEVKYKSNKINLSGVWSPDKFGELENIAKEMGGEVKSMQYKGPNGALTFVCKEGHEWKTKPINITQGRWCPECGILKRASSRKKYDSDSVLELVKKQNGKWVSGDFKNIKSRLTFECENKHRWTTPVENVIYGSWCKVCKQEENAKKLITPTNTIISFCKKHSLTLSEEFKGSRVKHLWVCKKGHKLESTYDNLRKRVKDKKNICKYCGKLK